MKVGDRIKSLRNKKDLTLRELAKKADISHSFLSDIENNRSNPSLKRLQDIARALNTTVSYLLGETPEEKSVDKIKKALADDPELLECWERLISRKDLQKMLKETKDLEPKTIQLIIEIAKIIKENSYKE